MTQSFEPLKPILVVDPVLEVDKTNSFAVVQGGAQIMWKYFTSNNIANSAISFTCAPPSPATAIDRLVLLTVPVRLTMTGVLITNNSGYTPSSSLLNSGGDAPRAFPLQGSIQSLVVNINTDSVTIPMSDVLHALMRYNVDNKIRCMDWSFTPNFLDFSFNYSDLTGTNLNPLGQLANRTIGTPAPRGGFPFTIVSGTNVAVTPAVSPGTAATAVVDMVITEPIFLSPMYYSDASEDYQGFYNVSSFDINLNFLNGAGFRMWSHNNLVSSSGADNVTSIINSISVQFNSFSSPSFSYPQVLPIAQFKYIAPNLLSQQNLSPQKPYSYSYHDIQRYPTDISTLSYADGRQPYTSSNIQLSSVPRYIFIYARPANSVLESRCDLTDCYLAISNCSIQWGTQSVVLASASQPQLFGINGKNGGNFDWSAWTGLGVYNSALPPNAQSTTFGGTGSVLKLEMGTDIQLGEGSAPSSSGTYQLLVNVTLANMNSSGAWDDIDFTLYVVVANEGVFTITGSNSAQHQVSILSTANVLEAASKAGISYRSVDTVRGSGDFLGSLRSFANRVNDFLRSSKIISTVASAIPHPIAQTIGSTVKSLGYGGCDGGDFAISGGARLSRAQLMSRL